MQELRLRTVGRFIPEIMYFYEGSAPVKDGVITLPTDPDRLVWAQRAFILGFRQDPDTGRLLSMDEIIDVYTGKTAESEGDDTDVAESVDSPDGGGQPVDSDGVRESEQPGGEGVPS